MDDGKWFVGILVSHYDSKKTVGISEYYDDSELEDEVVLKSNLTYEEADRECGRLHRELGLPMFDNMVDSY